ATGGGNERRRSGLAARRAGGRRAGGAFARGDGGGHPAVHGDQRRPEPAALRRSVRRGVALRRDHRAGRRDERDPERGCRGGPARPGHGVPARGLELQGAGAAGRHDHRRGGGHGRAAGQAGDEAAHDGDARRRRRRARGHGGVLHGAGRAGVADAGPTFTARSAMRASTRRRLHLTAAFAAYFVALWLLWETPVVYPLKVFVVLLHEISHGLAALATGGSVHRIVLGMDEGGATYAAGGNAFVVLSAGYLGSLAWGLALLLAARARAARVRLAAGALGVLLLVVAVLYVRNLFGIVFTLVFGAALLFASQRLGPVLLARMLTVLGLTSALYAVLDI